jgi:hypothetical protein
MNKLAKVEMLDLSIEVLDHRVELLAAAAGSSTCCSSTTASDVPILVDVE